MHMLQISYENQDGEDRVTQLFFREFADMEFARVVLNHLFEQLPEGEPVSEFYVSNTPPKILSRPSPEGSLYSGEKD